MNNENSTIRSLHELKTLFDSGAITTEEYEALKKRIIYGTSVAPELRPSEPAPPVMPATPSSVNPIETKIIYPSRPQTTEPPEPPITATPITEQNYDDAGESPMGVRPAPKKDWLLLSLAVLGALLLLGLLAYQFFNKPNSERLTSKSGPETEEVIPTPDSEGEATPNEIADTIYARPDRIPMATRDSATLPPTTPAPETAVNTVESPANAAGLSAAGLLTDKDQIIIKAQEILNAYYADMQAAPFEAANYFAPQVERYYTLANTTPAAITENITTYHFPEFLEGQSSIQENSMEVVNIGNNSYELTYLENGSTFRKSKNQKQETKAAVRVRFNPDFKITYFRQEQLLENRFITE